jgi:methylated-DNA-[protein]-cysteine S-methyltransferase
MNTVTSDFSAVLHLPFGPMGVICDDERITELVFLPPDTAERAPRNALAERAALALTRWIDDPQRPHGLPLALRGTPFQRRVWAAIDTIPRGHTRRYGDLAQALGSAARAVGGACGANPFPLLTPCHRVVGAKGLGGFARDTDGHLIRVKQWLLAHERRH